MNVSGRYVYYTIAKRMTKASLKAIGEIVGNRDHTTIIHGIEQFKDLMSVYDS